MILRVGTVETFIWPCTRTLALFSFIIFFHTFLGSWKSTDKLVLVELGFTLHAVHIYSVLVALFLVSCYFYPPRGRINKLLLCTHQSEFNLFVFCVFLVCVVYTDPCMFRN